MKKALDFLRRRSALLSLFAAGCTQNFGAFESTAGNTSSRDASSDAHPAQNGGAPSGEGGSAGAQGGGGTPASGGDASGGVQATAGGAGGMGGALGGAGGAQPGAGGKTTGGAGGKAAGGAGGMQAGGAGGKATGGAGGAESGGAPGAGGSSGMGGGPTTCATRYGSLPGYLLCKETAQQCRFVQATSTAQTCTAVCTSRGGTCVQADNGDPGSCTVTNAMVGCDAALASSICVCTR